MAKKEVNITKNTKVYNELKKKYGTYGEVEAEIFNLNVKDVINGGYAICVDLEEAEDVKACLIGDTITEDIQGTIYVYPEEASTPLLNRIKFIRKYGYDKAEK